MPAPTTLRGDWGPASGYAAGLELVRHDDATAVFVANDQMALGLVHALAEHGRRVPADVSVVGFDDVPEAGYLLPALTTVRQDFAEVGRRGLDLLLAMLPGSEGTSGDAHGDVIIAPELVVRASTAAPAR